MYAFVCFLYIFVTAQQVEALAAGTVRKRVKCEEIPSPQAICMAHFLEILFLAGEMAFCGQVRMHRWQPTQRFPSSEGFLSSPHRMA